MKRFVNILLSGLILALCGCQSAALPVAAEPELIALPQRSSAPGEKPFTQVRVLDEESESKATSAPEEKAVDIETKGLPGVRHARIAAVGDVMFMAHQIRAARTEAGYAFFPAFEYIAPYIGTADIAIANLETTIAGEDMGYSVSGELQEDGTKSLSYFNAPVELLDGMKRAGFNVLTTANNHTLDKGGEGLRRTIENIREQGLHSTGTFLSGDERFLVLDANGVSVAVLAYTTGTNKNTGGLSSSERREAVNLFDKELVLEDIGSARKAGAEVVVLCLHWGVEFSTAPTASQERQAEEFIEAGADVIVGAHPHVLQKIVMLETEGRKGIVAYSMGNFISNMTSDEHSRGAVLIIDIEKGETLTLRASYLPTLCKTVAGQRSVLPAAPSALDELTDEMTAGLSKAYERSVAVLGSEIVSVE